MSKMPRNKWPQPGINAPAIFIVLLLFLSGCCHLPADRGVATIEFERQEDNGSINIVPCILVLSYGQKVTLRGGEGALVSVRSGTLRITAFSIDPYTPHSDERAWHSPRVSSQATTRKILRVYVEPVSSGSTYIGGWFLHAAT
jgi:hypothetical protein